MFDVTCSRIAGVPVLRLQGSLVFGPPLEMLRAALRDLLASKEPRVVIGLEEVDKVDSSGIAALLALHGTLERKGGRLVLVQPSERLRATLTVMQLDSVLLVAGTAQEAALMLAENETT
jgi:serine/threonine-protein kinase RsbW